MIGTNEGSELADLDDFTPRSDEDSDEYESEEEFDEKQEPEEDLALGVKYTAAVNELTYLKASVHRKTVVLEEMRKSYLRDVVTLKHIMNEVLASTERGEIMTQYNSRIPSINLKEPLMLFSPEETQFTVKPCESCGGHLDLLINDNSKVEKLKKTVESYKMREEQLRIKIATSDAMNEKTTSDADDANRSHAAEVCVEDIISSK